MALASASPFFDFLREALEFLPPILTFFASRVPSSFFQNEPLTNSSATMSAIVAAAPSLTTLVLSVTLNTRDPFLRATVKVLAAVSTAETVPRNGIALALAAGDASAEAAADADGEGLAPGEADCVGAASAEPGPRSATAAMQRAAVIGDLSFIRLIILVFQRPAPEVMTGAQPALFTRYNESPQPRQHAIARFITPLRNNGQPRACPRAIVLGP